MRHTWDVCETIAILVSGEPFVDFVKSLHFISCCLRVTLERGKRISFRDLQQWFFASLEDRSSTISDSDQRAGLLSLVHPPLLFSASGKSFPLLFSSFSSLSSLSLFLLGCNYDVAAAQMRWSFYNRRLLTHFSSPLSVRESYWAC